MKNKTASEQKAQRLEYLKAKIAQLKNSPDVRAYLKFAELPLSAKNEIIEQWNAYYIRVRGGKTYEEFLEMKELLIKGNLAGFKQALKKQKERIEKEGMEIPKPSMPDPEHIARRSEVVDYLNSAKELAQLNSEAEGGF